MRNYIVRLAILALVLPLYLGCASTKMTKNWVYPERGPLQFENILVMVLVQDSLVRRSGEDELVRQIRKAKAIASYTLIPDQDMQNENRVRQAVTDSGVGPTRTSLRRMPRRWWSTAGR